MRILLLSSYHPAYREPLKLWGRALRKRGWHVTERYPDAYYREDVLAALAKGHDVVVYFGHGRPGAWCSYRGIDVKDFDQFKAKRPATWLISLSCYGMTRRNGRSLADSIMDCSIAMHVAAYKSKVKYAVNLACLNDLMELMGRGGILDPEFLHISLAKYGLCIESHPVGGKVMQHKA